MERSLRQIIPTVHWIEEVTLGVLSRVISQAIQAMSRSRFGFRVEKRTFTTDSKSDKRIQRMRQAHLLNPLVRLKIR